VNRKDLEHLMADTFTTVRGLNRTKGLEYATSDEALANFYRRAEALGIDPMTVWAVLFGKHVDAVMSYVREGEVQSEPIEGRIHDLILYSVLLLGLIKDAEDQAEQRQAVRADQPTTFPTRLPTERDARAATEETQAMPAPPRPRPAA
jgi:hypothetical protein